MSCEQQNEISSTPKVVWVVNPFDQLPNETDLPLRYWTLCRVLAEQGHEVIWWSSDFSHLSKTKRHKYIRIHIMHQQDKLRATQPASDTNQKGQ